MNIKAAKSVQGIAIQCIITYKRLTFKNNKVLYYQGMVQNTFFNDDIYGEWHTYSEEKKNSRRSQKDHMFARSIS